MNVVQKGLVVVAMLAAIAISNDAAAADVRSSITSTNWLELNGAIVGPVKIAAGGNVTADVVKEPGGEDVFVKKHLANPGYRDIVLQFDGNIDQAVYDWMRMALLRQYAPRDGAVIVASTGATPTVTRRLEFSSAQLT